ncbi:MAG: hypothetical protein IJO45_01430 [Oscillospiraceae bacterium]|nr:hypothetical protein [Oscillospiraceae bacterium]
MVGIRYLVLGLRKPVREPGWYPGLDIQGCIPWGWCFGCGTELFIPNDGLCERCRRKEFCNE